MGSKLQFSIISHKFELQLERICFCTSDWLTFYSRQKEDHCLTLSDSLILLPWLAQKSTEREQKKKEERNRNRGCRWRSRTITFFLFSFNYRCQGVVHCRPLLSLHFAWRPSIIPLFISIIQETWICHCL